MNKRKFVTMMTVLSPLLLWAGAALASTTGIAGVDTAINAGAINAGGRMVEAGCGFAVGAVGISHLPGHVIAHAWGHAVGHTMLTLLGASLVTNYAAVAPTFGAAGAALITIANHPITHVVTHIVVRSIS
jgi:hypothetical protein